jgi:DHA1 family tetracycline resistance protein-like MFS transporter
MADVSPSNEPVDSPIHHRRKPALVFIFITLVLDVLGFGLLIPVAPKLVESLLHGGQGGTEAEAAPFVAGLQSLFYAMAFLFAPALGVLSDRVGRRPVILISLFGSGVDYFMMAMAPTLGWLFVTRIINGLTGASFSVASAYVADVTPPERRAVGFGLIGAAFGLGFVIGPIIGGVLGNIDIRLPFYVAGGLTMVNWLYGLFVLPESLSPENRSPFRLRRANPIGAFYALGRYPLVAGMAVALFLVHMAQFALHATWVLYMTHRFSWTTLNVGASLAVVGIGSAVVQGGLARRMIPALGERRSLMLGLATGVLAFIGYGAATEGWMIYTIIAIASIGAIAQPAAQGLITKEVSSNEQGAIQGAIASLSSLAGIIGPLIGGITLAYFIQDPPPFPDSPIRLDGMNFYISAVIAALGWVAAAWAVRHHVERKSPAP